MKDRASISRVLVAVVSVLLGALLASCGGQAYRAVSAPPPTPAPVVNDADVAFVQQMIPHHQQAIQMARMAEEHSRDPRIRDLAGRIEATQSAEIRTMTGWLHAWGKPVPTSGPSMMPHMPMSPMPGMATDQDMSQMMGMRGPGFDRMFLQMMIRHHQGAIDMARTEQTQGINPDAKQLAHNIETGQSAEIAQMQQLLTTIPGH
jgi:uncharacterized protein (DUF305 family)